MEVRGGGQPGPAICKIAEEEGYNVILVGRRGVGSPAKRNPLGSVSDYVMSNSGIPVMLCKK